MDLQNLRELSQETLLESRNNLVSNLFNVKSFEHFNSVVGSLTLVLIEELKRKMLLEISIQEKKKSSEEEINKSIYKTITTYIGFWNKVICHYNHFSLVVNGSYFRISDEHIYNALKQSNPYTYEIYMNCLHEVSLGNFELSL